MNRCRLRVDVGGTSPDLVMIDFEGKIFYKKVPSTLRNRGVEVITGIQQILRHYSERDTKTNLKRPWRLSEARWKKERRGKQFSIF